MEGLPHELVAPVIDLEPVDLADLDAGDTPVVVGGGAAMVAGAAQAARTGQDWVAVPTTYAPACVHVRPAPLLVLADPERPARMPAVRRRQSLRAARAVAVEGLWAPDATPSTLWVSTSGLRTLHRAVAGSELDPTAVLRAVLLAGIGAANCAPGLTMTLALAVERHAGVPWPIGMDALLPRVGQWLGGAADEALETVADVSGVQTLSEALAVLASGAPSLPTLSEASMAAIVAELADAPYLSARHPSAADLRFLLSAR